MIRCCSYAAESYSPPAPVGPICSVEQHAVAKGQYEDKYDVYFLVRWTAIASDPAGMARLVVQATCIRVTTSSDAGCESQSICSIGCGMCHQTESDVFRLDSSYPFIKAIV